MSHLIILDDQVDCINNKIGDMQTVYHALKAHRAAQPEENNVTEAMDEALHDAEHFAQDLCQGNNLANRSIGNVTSAMEALLP